MPSGQKLERMRRQIAQSGAGALVVNDLTADDIPSIEWSGSPSHLRSVAALLERVTSGDIEYLALRAPGDEPVAKACIDYAERPEAGTLKQLATRDELQGLGLASRLIAVAEDRIRARGLSWVMLGVEPDNPRARALYERLGYVTSGRESASWEHEDEHGNVSLYETELEILSKRLER